MISPRRNNSKVLFQDLHRHLQMTRWVSRYPDSTTFYPYTRRAVPMMYSERFSTRPCAYQRHFRVAFIRKFGEVHMIPSLLNAWSDEPSVGKICSVKSRLQAFEAHTAMSAPRSLLSFSLQSNPVSCRWNNHNLLFAALLCEISVETCAWSQLQNGPDGRSSLSQGRRGARPSEANRQIWIQRICWDTRMRWTLFCSLGYLCQHHLCIEQLIGKPVWKAWSSIHPLNRKVDNSTTAQREASWNTARQRRDSTSSLW